MRVTFGMMKNNLIANLNKQGEKLLACENKAASGKEVIKPSDNPHAAAQILSYRSTLASIEQYQGNIDTAKMWIEVSDTTLDTVYSLLSEVIDVAGDNYSDEITTAESARQYIETAYEQILSLANSKTSGDYMYSGNQTRTAPFGNDITLDGGTSDDITFGLAADASNVTIEIYNAAGVLVRSMTGTGVAGVNTATWDGLDDFGSPCGDGEYSFIVSAQDAGGDVVADYPLYRGDDGPLSVQTSSGSTLDIANNGDELFSDILRNLNELMAVYENGAYDASDITGYIDALQASKEDLEAALSEQAVAYTSLETKETVFTKLKVTVEDALSKIEDADLTQAAVELEAQKTSYEACMKSVSSILEMGTLIDRIA